MGGLSVVRIKLSFLHPSSFNATWIYIDEIYLLFQHEYSANFLFTL